MSSHERIAANPERQTSELLEAISRADTVTIEFGTGDRPLFSGKTDAAFDADTLYIGVNIDPKQHKQLTDTLRESDGFALLVKKSDSGIEALPLPKGSADVVYMANVFGEPDSKYIMHDFKNASGHYEGHSSIDAKLQTLKTAAKLLKENGKVVIFENNTPYAASTGRAYERLSELLQSNGFNIEKAYDTKSDEWPAVSRKFSEPNEWWSFRSFLIVASPTLRT